MGGLTDTAADRAPDGAPDSSGPRRRRLIRPDRAERRARTPGSAPGRPPPGAGAYGRKVMLIVIRVSTGTPCSNVGS